MKEYTAHYFRSPKSNEIGPQAESVTFAATNKTEATKTAKNYAKQYDWRFLELSINQ